MADKESKIRVLFIGAHPDDNDIRGGGTALLYTRLGHQVKFISVTNGDAGHQSMAGATLARRRAEEARKAGEYGGFEYITLDNHDGELEPTLENRKKIIRLIREFKPDLVITHRPNDYHPDHRYTSTLVQDAMYMVTVPNICPDTPFLEYNPVLVYLQDNFTKPQPFQASVVVAIDEILPQKLKLLDFHVSQVYEWLPYNYGYLDKVPGDREGRLALLKEFWAPRWVAEPFRDLLIQEYGPEKGKDIQYAEAFEAGEHGASLTPDTIHQLFPFF